MRRRFLAQAIVLSTVVAAAPAMAAIYTSQANFLAANSHTKLVSFSGLTPTTSPLGSPFTLGGLTISAPALYAADTGFWGSIDSLYDNSFNGSISLSFVPTMRLGFFLANSFVTGYSPAITFKSGNTTVFTDSPVAGGVNDSFSYYGVDGIGSFDSVTIAAGDLNAFVSIADVSFGFVPEPANWVMLIAGFGLVGAVMRRRRAAVVTL